METVKINAKKRENTGRRGSLKLRQEGQIPAVIYGGKKENLLIHMEEKSLRKALSQKPESLEIEVEGSKEVEKVKVLEFQMDPFGERLLHLDFKRLDK